MTTRRDYGSNLEEVVYKELLRRGLREGVHFAYQVPFFGIAREKGSFIIDFYFTDPPNLAVNVQGEYYHYIQHGSEGQAKDRLLKAMMAGKAITLIFLDETDILNDVRGIVGDALSYIDRSSVG